jgi:hypothetical protein
MKLTKLFLTTTVFVMLLITSCTNSNGDGLQEISSEEISNQNFTSGLAFVEINAKPISESDYIVEIRAIDFSNSGSLPTAIGYGEYVFNDDGSLFDVKANDGIYTIMKSLTASEKFKEMDQVIPLMEYPRVTESFTYKDEFNQYLSDNKISVENVKAPDCRIILCDCYECNCMACSLFDAICWKIEQLPCGITIAF